MIGALVLLPMLGACATDLSTPGTPAALPAVVVGSTTSVPDDLIARLYAGALHRMGTRVATVSNLRDRAAVLAALDANRITVAPDFTGRLLRHLDANSRACEPEKVLTDLSASLPQGLSVSDPSDTTDLRPEGAADAKPCRLPAENPVPVYRTGDLSSDQITKLNTVAGELTTADLTDMVHRVEGHVAPADIAHSWLDLHGF